MSPMDVFIILQLFANDFRVRTKGQKKQHYKKLYQSDISTLLTLLNADAKSAVLLRVLSLTKDEIGNIPLLNFPKCFQIPKWFMDNLLCLCNMWKGRSYTNENVSVSSIFNNGQFYLKYYLPCHRNLPSKRLSKAIATSLFSIFIHQNIKSTTSLNIYNILEKYPKALLRLCLIDVDRLKLPSRPQNVIFEHVF